MIKKTAKRAAKGLLRQSKRTIVKVPVLRKTAVRAKAVLYANITGPARETYHYHNYYPSIADYVQQAEASKHFANKPLISLVMPTYNTPDSFLRECIDSVRLQSYDNWELCIADDASTSPSVVKTIKEYTKLDKRIKLVARKTNGHISLATNSALDIAKGDFISLLDHDDVLWPNALYEVVKVINETPKVDLIYTDEDKIDAASTFHSYPFLKPDWSPEFLESCNYITHFSTIRASLMREIGGLRKGYEGAQDWDLFIRITEKTQNIVHIPKLLYSWRIHEDSTAANTDAKPYVYEAQAKLLADHVKRSGREAEVETGIITQHRTIKYAIDPTAWLTVVILYQDLRRAQTLLSSLVKHTPGARIDIVILPVRTVSTADKTALQAIVPEIPMLFMVADKPPIDYKQLATTSDGDYLLFIKDSIEITTDLWAKTAIGDCQLDGVGLVGPVILHVDRQTIASAGVGLGYGAGGVTDMLQGTPFDDPHYSRGLYAKSRRNVSAVNEAAYFIKRQTLLDACIGSTAPQDALQLAAALTKQGARHIYTPYIQVVTHDYLNQAVAATAYDEDPFLNPNFNRANQSMEVKA